MKRRARITWAIPTMKAGGTETQLLHLMKGLIDDYDLTLICTRSEGALIGDARRLGVTVRVLGVRSGWDFRVQRRIERVLRAQPPDILHTFLSGFDLYANRAAYECDVPIIISSRRELAEWQKRRHLFMQRRANKYVDCIIANSQAVADYASDRENEDSKKFQIIRNGIVADHFVSRKTGEHVRKRYKIPLGGIVIGMVANFTPVKDHPLLLDIARNVIKRHKNVHFLLVGTGPLANAILNTIRHRKQSDYFTRVATVSELADLYCAMGITVLCSKMEGSPNVLLEAMASGTPTVSAAVGGIPEIIEDGVTGCLVTSRNPQDFADIIHELITNPKKHNEIAKNADAWVRKHRTLDTMVAQYEQIYKTLLQQKYGERK